MLALTRSTVCSARSNIKVAWQMFNESLELVKRILRPALWLYLISEVLNILCNRVTHHIVNQRATPQYKSNW